MHKHSGYILCLSTVDEILYLNYTSQYYGQSRCSFWQQFNLYHYLALKDYSELENIQYGDKLVCTAIATGYHFSHTKGEGYIFHTNYVNRFALDGKIYVYQLKYNFANFPYTKLNYQCIPHLMLMVHRLLYHMGL